jgi:hypothetical protein
MAINYSYPRDSVIDIQDLFLGIRSSNNTTVNYTARSVSNFLNHNAEISISSQLSFKFTVSENIPKSISFVGGGGNNTLFSNITELVISIIDLSSSNVTTFLDYLIDTDIILVQQNEPNNFGHYKIINYTQNSNPDFYTLELEFIGGSGNILENTYYNISPLNLNQGGNASTLQNVLLTGNTATDIGIDFLNSVITGRTLGITSDGIIGFDENSFFLQIQPSLVGITSGTFQVSLEPGQFSSYDSSTGAYGFLAPNRVSFSADGTIETGLDAEKVSINGVDYLWPNTITSRIATLLDIPSVTGYVPYIGATSNVDLGTNDLYLRGIYSNWGAPGQGVFWINTETGAPYMLFGDGREYDGSNVSVNFQVGVEGGISYGYTNATNGNSTTVNAKNEFIVECFSGTDPIVNGNLYVTPTEVATNRKFQAFEGFEVYPFPGSASNFFNIGTYYGGNPNFRQILFSNYGDDIEYSSDKSITVSANIEEGFSATVIETDGQLGQIAVNYSGINLQVNDNTDTNLTSIYPTYTDFQKTIITQEGYWGNYIQFDTTAIDNDNVARLKWNDVDGTLNLGLKGGSVVLQIGQEQVIRVVNKTTPLINLLESNYQVCVVSGATGQRVSVRLAQANNDANSAGTLGVVTETINANQEGFITTSGQVREINTTGALQGETWSDGDILYLSPTTAGAITNVKPTAPNHTVIVGYVEYAHAIHGKIYVKIDNGYELDELHNVRISSPLNGEILTYNSTNELWENQENILLQTKRMWNTYRATTNSIVSIGNSVGYNLGAGQTARSLTGDAYERQQRIGVVSLTGPNAVTSYRLASLHFTLDGLEYFEQTFGNVEGMTDSATRVVHGIFTDVGVLSGNVEYNTLLNFIGVCKLSTSTNWHVVHNDNSGLATTIDLGSNFPSNVTKEKFTYRIIPKGTNNVDVTFTRHLTGAKTTVNITTNMPSTAVLMTGKGALNTNTSTVAVGMDFFAVTELFK